MKLEFSGAAHGVTGSKHLLWINGKKVLLDCGLFQGRRKQSFEANLHFPFDAREIDAVVLSHAHIDHSGAIPVLVKNGFTGPVYCTHATRDLCSIMLKDSAYIQEKDAEWIRKKGKDKNAEPLYTIADAERSLTFFRSVDYHQPITVAPDAKVTFYDAGHILGSAMEEWQIHDQDTGQDIRFGFTGDLGRKNLPILKDPEQLRNLDVLISESTYGGRYHDEISNVSEKFAEVIKSALARGGKIIIPAFSVERTQEILYVIRELEQNGKLPSFPIFVDSPLSTAATGIFALHPECFDEEIKKLFDAGEDPFGEHSGKIQFTRSVDESKALNNFPGSAMIISASGMCEAGRVRHHLYNHIEDPSTLILVVGFMAKDTLGRKIVEKQNPVNIFGEPKSLNAEVQIFNAFSAHADRNDLLKFAENAGALTTMFLVHGEDDALEKFEEGLRTLPNLKNTTFFAPTPGETFELTTNKKWKKLTYKNPISERLFGVMTDEHLSSN